VPDVERFVAHLRAQGVDDKQIAGYRRYLAELTKYPSLSAAINAAEGAGVAERELANLRKVAHAVTTRYTTTNF
jgi:hypothetical protein